MYIYGVLRPWCFIWVLLLWSSEVVVVLMKTMSDKLLVNEVVPIKMISPIVFQQRLGDNCSRNSDCTPIRFAHCHDGTCSCYPYHIPYNVTMCLPASLLGYSCLIDEQCRMKVAYSQCVNGECICQKGFTQLRKDSCLAGARVGQFCANDEQCRLWSPRSYCKFIIPRVYGRCGCSSGLTTDQDKRCVPFLGSPCLNDTFCRAIIRHSHCGYFGGPNSYVLGSSQSTVASSHGPTFVSFLPRQSSQNNSNNSRASSVHKGLVFGPYSRHCLCEKGFRASDDRRQCLPYARVAAEIPISLGKYCDTSDQCQSRDPYSHCVNHKCHCMQPNPHCDANNTGCHKDTFQCRNGQCISWYFVCDGHFSCDDGSDEEECVKKDCPRAAFQCGNGDCISKAKLCNGKLDCLDGSDEFNCYGDCNTTSVFRCKDGSACLPQYMFCNAVSSCKDQSDEDPAICSSSGDKCPPGYFKCANGRCRSTAVVCSGKDGCGDNSDERHCKVCYCPKA